MNTDYGSWYQDTSLSYDAATGRVLTPAGNVFSEHRSLTEAARSLPAGTPLRVFNAGVLA